MCLAQGPQRSDAGEARTRYPSVSSQALYHWATALPLYTNRVLNVRKKGNIRNRSNQVPHQTQNIIWKSEKKHKKHHKQEPRGQPFPSRWPAGRKEQTGQYERQIRNTNNKKNPQKKHRLDMLCKKITGGLIHFLEYLPIPFSDVHQDKLIIGLHDRSLTHPFIIP